MAKLTFIKNESCRIIPLHAKKEAFTVVDFFAPYGALTNEVFLQFLDTLYREYKTTDHYKTLAFSEVAEVDFNFFLLRIFLEGLQR
jgi:hypothetical protein